MPGRQLRAARFGLAIQAMSLRIGHVDHHPFIVRAYNGHEPPRRVDGLDGPDQGDEARVGFDLGRLSPCGVDEHQGNDEREDDLKCRNKSLHETPTVYSL